MQGVWLDNFLGWGKMPNTTDIEKAIKEKFDQEEKEEVGGITVSNSTVSGSVLAGGNSTVTAHFHGKEDRFDDSAKLQGREPIRERKYGEKIHPKHMTPKEYRNFEAGIWDGIETRKGLWDWTAWDWTTSKEVAPKSAKKTKPTVERRQVPDRRTKMAGYNGKNKRKKPRREDEMRDLLAFHICSSIAFLTVFVLMVLVIFYNIDWQVIK